MSMSGTSHLTDEHNTASITDQRAFEIKNALVYHLMEERKAISERNYRLYETLISNSGHLIPQELSDPAKKRNMAAYFQRKAYICQELTSHLTHLSHFLNEYTLRLAEQNTISEIPRDKIGLFDIYLATEKNNIKYRIKASSDEPTTLDRNGIQQEYEELLNAINNQRQDISITTKNAIIKKLMEKYHIIPKDKGFYFSDPKNVSLRQIKSVISQFSAYQPIPSDMDCLTEKGRSNLNDISASVKNRLTVNIGEDNDPSTVNCSPQDLQEVLDKLKEFNHTIEEGMSTEEELLNYINNRINNLSIQQRNLDTFVDSLLMRGQENTDNWHTTKNSKDIDPNLLTNTTPPRRNSLWRYSISSSNFTEDEQEAPIASRNTMKKMKNPAVALHIFNVNPFTSDQKKAFLASLLDKKTLSAKDQRLIAILVKNETPIDQDQKEKVKTQLRSLLKTEHHLLRKTESKKWIQEVDTALLQVTKYLDDEIAKIDKKDRQSKNPNTATEKTTLEKKRTTIHEALENMHKGTPITTILGELRENQVIAEKRRFFRSNTLKKIQKITLKYQPLLLPTNKEGQNQNEGVRLATYCVALRKETAKIREERAAYTNLALALLESVESHIQVKHDSIFTVDKKTLKNRLQAIEAAKIRLSALTNADENKKPKDTHSDDIAKKLFSESEPDAMPETFEESKEEINTTDRSPTADSIQAILGELKTNENIKKQRFWIFAPIKTETEKLIEAAATICASAT